MQWQVNIKNENIKLNLPSCISDDLPFQATIDGKVIHIRWQKHTNTFYLIEEAASGKKYERPLPLRYLNLRENIDSGKHEIDIEFSTRSPFVLHSKVGRYVFGQDNRDKAAQAKGAKLRSPMTGKVLQVLAKNDQQVSAGSLLFVIEAMKMENKIIAPIAGILSEIKINEGDQVNVNDLLAKIK
ncbi:MAG: acetyl-CoA carboxylase biotin carboxyl carrier protein subunit [Bdellovibrionota bacterium]